MRPRNLLMRLNCRGTERMMRVLPIVILLGAACADEIPESVSTHMEAARAAHEAAADSSPDVAQLLMAAPPGGYIDWVRDVRVGLDTVPTLAMADRGEALHVVQELYTRRFESLRAFYGEGGAVDVGAGVSQAIGLADTQLQELMRRLASTDADDTMIAESVGAAQQALSAIEEAGKANGLPDGAPRDLGSATEP